MYMHYYEEHFLSHEYSTKVTCKTSKHSI